MRREGGTGEGGREEGSQGWCSGFGLDQWVDGDPFTERRKLRSVGKTMGSDLDTLIWRGLIQV